MKKQNRKIGWGLYAGFLILFFCVGQQQIAWSQSSESIPPTAQQIKAAVSAAPQSMRNGAKVYGYDQHGKWTTLRAGSNELICIADDPAQPKFHVACYFKDLEPFMKIGRDLRAQGKSHEEIDNERRKEIKAGTLKMPNKPMGLYNLSGPESAFNYKTGTLENASPLYVVYIPFATEKSTGIATSPPGPGAPWLMEAGQPWAHIMIPGQSVGEKPGSE